MLDLSGRGDEDVKQICSTALNQVPPDMVQLDDKMVKVLVSLLTATGTSIVGDGGNTVSEPSVHDLKPWSSRSSSIAENPVGVHPSWINYVCQDFEVKTSLLLCTSPKAALAFPAGISYYAPLALTCLILPRSSTPVPVIARLRSRSILPTSSERRAKRCLK